MSENWNDLPTVETMIALPKAELDALRDQLHGVEALLRQHMAENERLRDIVERLRDDRPIRKDEVAAALSTPDTTDVDNREEG